MKNNLRLSILVGVLLFFSCMISTSSVQAYSLQERTLRVSTPKAGNTNVTYSFSFDHTVAPLGSIEFIFCTSPVETTTCVAPSGIDLSGSNLFNQSGEIGFSILSRTANSITLSRPLVGVVTPTSLYEFNGVTNPSSGTIYVRIKTYSTVNASGPYTDFGATSAGIINSGISVTAKIPPFLQFCVAVTMPTDCSSGTGSVIDFGRLTPGATATATSVSQVATNGDFGYIIQVTGTTMYAGLNAIPALTTPSVSQTGVGQFGFNLKQNTSPVIGTNAQYNNVDSSGQPEPSYNLVNQFVFRDSDVIARSVQQSDYVKYTNSYIINIPPTQEAGYYATTLTFICTASY